MASGDTTDVTATLTDLERKLVDLERQLGAVASGPASPPDVTRASAGTAAGDTPQRVEELRAEIAGLVRFRDQLEAAVKDLTAEYDRMLGHLRPATAAGTQGDTLTLSGSVKLNAGPFADMASLQRFEHALLGVDGAEMVELQRFESGRATFDLQLAQDVALVRALKERLRVPITSSDIADDRLTIDIGGAASHGT
jgi:hypothetical protein